MLQRLLIAMLVILLLVLGVAPWVIGMRTEQRYRQIIAAANNDWPGIRLRLQDYERGWFASRAAVRVDVLEAGSTYHYTGHIAHGPLPLAAGRWRPALVYVESALQPLTGAGQRWPLHLTADYALGLTGAIAATLRFLPLHVETGRGHTLDWNGGVLRYQVPAAYDQLKVSLQMQPLRADGGAVRIQLQGLSGNLHLRLGEHGLWLGTARLGFQRLSLGDRHAGGAPRSVQVLDFSIAGHGATHSGVFTAQLAATLEGIRLPEAMLGPGRLELSATGLDAAALARLQHYALNMRIQGLGGRALAMAMLGTLLVESPELFQHQPRLELHELTLSTSQGKLYAQGYLTLATNDPRVLNNPYLLTRAIEARLHARVPAALARRLVGAYLRTRPESPDKPRVRVAKLLDRYVAAGALARDDGAYQAEIRYTEGTLVINGKPWGAIQRAAALDHTDSTTNPDS